jgi:hypothetical protein
VFDEYLQMPRVEHFFKKPGMFDSSVRDRFSPQGISSRNIAALEKWAAAAENLGRARARIPRRKVGSRTKASAKAGRPDELVKKTSPKCGTKQFLGQN